MRPASANESGAGSGRPAGLGCPVGELPEQHPEQARRGGRPPGNGRPPRPRPRAAPPRIAVGSSTTSARPSSPSPCRGARPRTSSSAAAASRMPARAAHMSSPRSCPAASASDGRDERQLGDEAVVVGGQLAVEAAREGVAASSRSQQAAAVARHVALREPGKRRRPRPAAGGLRNRRGCWPRSPRCGTPRGRAGATDLAQRQSSLCSNRSLHLGQPSSSRGSRPRRSAGRRSRSHWSSARRRGTGLAPTTSAAGGDRLGVALVAGDPPRGREHGEVMVARELPDLLDVAGLGSSRWSTGTRAVARRAPAGDGSRNQSGSARSARATPSSSQSPDRIRSAAARAVARTRVGDQVAGDHVDAHGTVEARQTAPLRAARRSWTHAPDRHSVAGRDPAPGADDLPERHLRSRRSVPAERRLTASGAGRAAASTARVARWSRRASERDRHRPPRRTARRTLRAGRAGPCPARSASACLAPSAGPDRRPVKLSSRALRPPPVTSNVSLGSGGCPPVA